MKKIKLISLGLQNFKGVKEFKLAANGRNVDISGENGAGKTTLVDAFTWVLFNKDSKNSSKFEILPLDKDNNMIPYTDSTVELILDVDGTVINLKKVLMQKWTKKRGQAEKVFEGTKTVYSIDDVPCRMKDYTAKVQEIMDEQIFKLVTNPKYANTELKWQDLRKILVELAGTITDEDILKNDKDLEKLLDVLKTKTLEELKKQVAASKKKMNDRKKEIPARIDEASKNAVIQVEDEKGLEVEEEQITQKIQKIESQIANVSKLNQKYDEDLQTINNKKHELNNLKFDLEMKAGQEKRDLETKLQDRTSDLEVSQAIVSNCEQIIEEAEQEIKNKETELAGLRDKYKTIHAEKLEITDDFICPTCKQPLPHEDIEVKKREYEYNFNEIKKERLAAINETGLKGKVCIEERKKEIETAMQNKSTAADRMKTNIKQIDDLKAKIDSFKIEVDYSSNKRFTDLSEHIRVLETALDKPTEINANVLEERRKLNKRLEEINQLLADIVAARKLATQSKARVEELKAEEKDLAQKIANLERQEFMIENYTTVQSTLVEERVNKMFKIARFKLFNKLVNGGLEDCCETIVDGVPYNSNLNSAMQINAGVDIINVLNKYYGIQAPIFIDNRESTNELIDTENQIINLRVSKDKGLKINVLPTAEEIAELDEIIEKMNEELGDYDMCVEDLETFPHEATEVGSEYGEKHRWWQEKIETYEYKGILFEFCYQEPLTEMQEGQNTNPQVYRVEN